MKQWIREQAKMFLDKYFAAVEMDSKSQEEGKMDDQSLLKQLTAIAQTLTSSNVSCENLLRTT